jgi:hypothetical protein
MQAGRRALRTGGADAARAEFRQQLARGGRDLSKAQRHKIVASRMKAIRGKTTRKVTKPVGTPDYP